MIAGDGTCPRARAPQHPGALLRDSIFPALELSVSQAARDLLITRQTLHRILAGQAAITPGMALRLERLCGVSSSFWLDRQQQYELDQLSAVNENIISQIPARRLPENFMENIGVFDER